MRAIRWGRCNRVELLRLKWVWGMRVLCGGLLGMLGFGGDVMLFVGGLGGGFLAFFYRWVGYYY